MKLRHGFVSNSSSSSFCIYGMMTKMFQGKEPEEVEREIEQTLRKGSVLTYYVDYEDSGFVYIGFNPRDIKDNQTGAEFKAMVREEISKYFPALDISGADWICEEVYR